MSKVVPSILRLIGFVIRLTDDEKAEVRRSVQESGGPSIRFWILLLLSTVIAAFGLLTNSAAVIIGAMIIAPLMGPILASALAIDAGDYRLLGKALTAEVLGVLAAISLGFVIGHIPMNFGVTNEMLARTTPTLFDLFIAAASGLAAGYATVDKKIGSALAGVAISVALVPPLATCGLLVALGAYGGAWGAFLLFFANFLAIQIAAGLVFFIYGVADIHALTHDISTQKIMRFAPSLVMLLAVGIFMTSTLISLASERRLETSISSVLSREIGARSGGQLDKIVRRGRSKDGYDVVAVALTPQPFDSMQVGKIEEVLRSECRPDIHLVIRSVSSSDADRDGQVFLTDSQLTSMREREEEQNVLSLATQAMGEHLDTVPGARLVNLVKTQTVGRLAFTAVVRTPVAITPDQVAGIEASMDKALGRKATLTVRSVLTREADAKTFKYEAARAEELTPEEVALRQRIKLAIEDRVKAIPGAVTREVSFSQSGPTRNVRVLVEAPAIIGPETVAQYQSDLRTYVDPGVSLEVKTTVVATVTAEGLAPR